MFGTRVWWKVPSQSAFGCQRLLRLSPVAALTLHRSVIHYRDCASLTQRESQVSGSNFRQVSKRGNPLGSPYGGAGSRSETERACAHWGRKGLPTLGRRGPAFRPPYSRSPSSLAALATTPLRASRASRFGMTIRPLNMSDISHTRETFWKEPTAMNTRAMTP